GWFVRGECGERGAGGAAVARVERLGLAARDARVAQVGVTGACGVENPLCGEEGASAVFGPQKGAAPAVMTELGAALRRFSE
ncbi:glycerate kinase, partial [Cronobacter sakazakii]|uniref:glycerate kinase n=1 Tax=Cronobacter sakazakii TaxID=28141 RepID=UPI000D51FCC5